MASSTVLTGDAEPSLQSPHLKKLNTLLHRTEDQGFHGLEVCLSPKKSRSKPEAGIVLLANHTHIRRYLAYLSLSGRKKLEAKAYLWHYQYTDLPEAFDRIESVLDQYSLCH